MIHAALSDATHSRSYAYTVNLDLESRKALARRWKLNKETLGKCMWLETEGGDKSVSGCGMKLYECGRKFFSEENQWLVFWCQLAGLDHKYIVSMANERIKKASKLKTEEVSASG